MNAEVHDGTQNSLINGFEDQHADLIVDHFRFSGIANGGHGGVRDGRHVKSCGF